MGDRKRAIRSVAAAKRVTLGVGGRLLFATTARGTVRAYKLPLGEAFQEIRCSDVPLTQLALSADHLQLFAADARGAIYAFDVKDRDPSRSAGGGGKDDRLPWAEEFLVTRSVLEDWQQRVNELEAQVWPFFAELGNP